MLAKTKVNGIHDNEVLAVQAAQGAVQLLDKPNGHAVARKMLNGNKHADLQYTCDVTCDTSKDPASSFVKK